MTIHHEILRIESAIHDCKRAALEPEKARRIIRTALQNLAQIKPDSSLSLRDTFIAIATETKGKANRDLSAAYIRLISTEGILPEGSIDEARPHIIQQIEESFANLVSNILDGRRAQTHEKMHAAATIHRNACDHMQQLKKPLSSLQDLVSRRQVIMSELNHGPTKRYLNTYNFTGVRTSVSGLLKLADEVVHSQGHMLQTTIQSFVESIDEEISHFKPVQTFITQEYLTPFLNSLRNVALEFRETLVDRFDCAISVPKSPYKIQKKYPLHVVNSTIKIFVPLANEGPGVAQDVRAYAMAEHCEIRSDETKLGDVEPGRFILTSLVEITQPLKRLEVFFEVTWKVIGDHDVRRKEFSVLVDGQRTDLNWDTLRNKEPYSLEVAYRSDFFGRKDAVQRILRRLAPNSMQSCYVTGQKRVGKSSLARAIESQIKAGVYPNDYQVLYLECGEIRHTSGEETLKELGLRLEEFFQSGLTYPSDWEHKEYSTSLTPLSRLVDKVYRENKQARFITILDEFDEINEDLYRYGDLANTFFLNLRMLASKTNVAFILVGAERMPYVMSSQGDRLNKFSRESLDSFNMESEWQDYRDMIETPVSDSIKYYEHALRTIFELTNGHPYFTKVLCARLYEYVVDAKDAEVSSAEIMRAKDLVLSALDGNAFAHYWRDGIRGTAEDIEISSLKRCRVLVGWARAARSGKSPTSESIERNLYSGAINWDEVLPILDDFARRGVFVDIDECYSPAVRLFADWLIEGGFSELISDQLGDELAEVRQKREDDAYISSTEIVDVVSTWDLYQGREITAETVRAWIGQVDSNVQKRILFKALQNVRYVRDPEIREKFVQAHNRIRNKLPTFVKHSRAQRRDDIFVSYLDGPGKSGAHYASLYANANEILSSNVVDPDGLERALSNVDSSRKIGFVVVDDLVGTGNNLADNLSRLSDLFQQSNIGLEIPLSIVTLCSTVVGERRVRSYLEEFPNADLEVCETLENRHYAFPDDRGFWETDFELEAARDLFTELGRGIQKRRPLGYNNQGLLLTFSRNCPNNSLPILHGHGKGNDGWFPLFPRTKT